MEISRMHLLEVFISLMFQSHQVHQCLKGVYPFHDGRYEDFARVFDYLIKVLVVLRHPV